ncbi:MAG: hypothetical protein K0S29_1016 [Gammaproteobacteria bacterium]|jgi:putative membrane protein|nr:hypothetical protein [Gammaproteobacteria bacterium]
MQPLNIAALVLLALGVVAHFALPQILYLPGLCFFIAVLLHSYMVWGLWRTGVYVAGAMIIGFIAEALGVNTGGWLFGVYYYNPAHALYHPAILSVPLYIPVVYSYLLYAGNFVCIAISRNLLKRSNILVLALLSGIILTLKDLATDPLRSTVDQAWIWTNGGSYFGVPVHNFIGWTAVFTIMTLIVVSITWMVKGYNQTVIISKNTLYFPVLLLLAVVLFGFIGGLQAPAAYSALGCVSAFISVICLAPFFILAWFNSFK